MAKKEELQYYKEIKDAIEKINNAKKSSLDYNELIKTNEELITYQKEKQREAQRLLNEEKDGTIKLSASLKKELESIVGEQKEINNQLIKEQKNRQILINSVKYVNSQIKIGWNFLQQQDKVFRNTILNLGMSGTKAELMRNSFEESAAYVARLGGNIQDINDIMSGYADETGRARVLSAEMVKDVTNIGKGTNIGIQNATRLAAQFELMGFDARTTMEYVQGVVDTSERMGVNTTKVLKNINDNFKRLSTYTFQQGVQGFAQMATYAEKFKIDIDQALNAADVSRSLEGAVDLAAQLQVMGGEFAKTDPYQLLFLSRNDPAKYAEKLSEMTKGIVTFRKVTDSKGNTTFEKFISPADRDRLAAVAKSLGISNEEITQIAYRRAEMDKLSQRMRGMGLTGREKELIEGAAIFNSDTGRFQVKLGNTMKNVTELTKTQAASFVTEQESLEERAKQAQTFNETLQTTINSLKATLLPILHGVNGVLEFIKPKIDKGLKWVNKKDAFLAPWVKSIGALMTAGLLWKGIPSLLSKAAGSLITKGSKFKNIGGSKSPMFDMVKNKDGTLNVGASKARFVGQTNLAKAQGTKNLKTGAGVGAAALGIGAGIGVAAVGISKLADSMSKLKPKQAEVLKSIVQSLGWFIVGGMAAAGIIIAVGGASTAASVGLLALGAAALGIGAGIGIAAAGIGYMATGIGEMVEKSKGAGTSLMEVATGVGALSLAMMGFTAGALGFLTFAGVMKTISTHADDLFKVGDAFKQINAVLSGNKEDFKEVEKIIKSISSTDISKSGVLGELSNLLKSPLKVEFASDKVALTNDITLNLDGKEFFRKTYDVKLATQKFIDLKNGKGS